MDLKAINGRERTEVPGNGIHLPSVSPDGIDFATIIEDIEKSYFEDALKLAKGNESKAAQLLNLTRDKFRYRRQKLDENPENAGVRRKVGGLPSHLSIFELGFAGKGRIYYSRGSQRPFRILSVGGKAAQKADLEYLSRLRL